MAIAKVKLEEEEKEEQGDRKPKIEPPSESTTERRSQQALSSEAERIRKRKMGLPVLTDKTTEALLAATPVARPRSAQSKAIRAAERMFTHKYDPRINESIAEAIALLQEPVAELVGKRNDAGTFLVLSDYLAQDEADLDMEVPEDFDSMFVTTKRLNAETTTPCKNLRSLEGADLKVERIEVYPSKIEPIVVDPQDKYRAVQKPDTSVFPKPWILPSSGELNFSVLKRMAESILVKVASSPGILVDDIAKAFALLQSSLVVELVELLEEIGCLTVATRPLKSMIKASPFQQDPPEENVQLLMPTRDALEKFASFTAHHDGRVVQRMDVDA